MPARASNMPKNRYALEYAFCQETFVLCSERALHDILSRFFRSERQGRNHIGSEIDSQNPHDGKRQRDTIKDIADVRN
jgi:hypothetical protein